MIIETTTEITIETIREMENKKIMIEDLTHLTKIRILIK